MKSEDLAQFLSKIRVKPPRELLEQLARRIEATGSPSWESRPLLTLGISNGQQLTGRLIAWTKDKDAGGASATVVLAGLNHNGTKPESLVYVCVANVVSCIVHNLENEVDRLTFGDMSYRPNEEAPSRLELKRLAETLGGKLQVDWDSVPEIPTALLNLRDLMKATKSTLDNLEKEELGKKSLAPIVHVILRHAPGEAIAVRNDVAKLLVQADLTKNLSEKLSAALKDCIEKKL